MIDRLFKWLNRSTSSFLAVATIAEELERKGFKQLKSEENWQIEPGGKYYLVKNNSAIFAFIAGTKPDSNLGYRIISAHSDSPALKLKPNPEILGKGGVVSLNVEKYGGAILYTWFDRPLSMSGRVIIKSKDPFHPTEVIFDLKKPVATIPHLAIHFNRNVNEGNRLSVQKDMKPVLGVFTEKELVEAASKGGLVKKMICENLNIDPKDYLDAEIILYPCFEAQRVGLGNRFFQSCRIDDLSMAFAGLQALSDCCEKEMEATRILAVFDNEETGSSTKQGAASPVFKTLLRRIESSLGNNEETFQKKLSNTFMISADCAHAWHPNYPEVYDPTNSPVIGGGPVIKINAAGKYMTDAVGSSIFINLCEEVGVKYQFFVNHSDFAGGSTLGNILTSQIDIKGVDVGAPIWGMHSAVETGGISDYVDFVKVFTRFWEN